jgi:hypothetical protein
MNITDVNVFSVDGAITDFYFLSNDIKIFFKLGIDFGNRTILFVIVRETISPNVFPLLSIGAARTLQFSFVTVFKVVGLR